MQELGNNVGKIPNANEYIVALVAVVLTLTLTVVSSSIHIFFFHYVYFSFGVWQQVRAREGWKH